MPNIIQPIQKPEGSGIGGIIAGVLGAASTIASGGLAAPVTGAALGAAATATRVGEAALSKPKGAAPSAGAPNSAISRRLQSQSQQLTGPSAQLQDAIAATHEPGLPKDFAKAARKRIREGFIKATGF